MDKKTETTKPEAEKEVKLSLIAEEKRIWENTRILLEIRYRVNKRLNNQVAMDAVEKELFNCEVALNELDKMAAELQA